MVILKVGDLKVGDKGLSLILLSLCNMERRDQLCRDMLFLRLCGRGKPIMLKENL